MVHIQGEPATHEKQEAKARRHTLVIWFHETDRDLALTLEPHIQLLTLRLNNRFQPGYFQYPKSMPKPPGPDDVYTREDKLEALDAYQKSYAGTVQLLGRAALLLPYISPAFMLQFCRDYQQDQQLRAALTQPIFPILPIPMRPMAGMGSLCLERPLAAYAQGCDRETACATIAAVIEAVLRERYPSEEVPHTPFLLLETKAASEAPRTKRRFFKGRTR